MLPTLLTAVLLAPPDPPPGSAAPAPSPSPPTAADREAEDLAAFSLLLGEAVAPLYGLDDRPAVTATVLPGGDAVFVLSAPQVRVGEEEPPAAKPAKPPGGCPWWAWTAFERARFRGRLGGNLGGDAADACQQCHGDGDAAEQVADNVVAFGGVVYDERTHTFIGTDPGEGGSPSPRLFFGEDVIDTRTVRPHKTPHVDAVLRSVSNVLTEYAGQIRGVPAGGRVSVGVTFEAPPAPELPAEPTADEVREAELVSDVIRLRLNREDRKELSETAKSMRETIEVLCGSQDPDRLETTAPAHPKRPAARALASELAALYADAMRDYYGKSSSEKDRRKVTTWRGVADLLGRPATTHAAGALSRLSVTAVVRDGRNATVEAHRVTPPVAGAGGDAGGGGDEGAGG